MLQRVAACCSVLQRAGSFRMRHNTQRVAACCSVLQRVAACCSVLQRVAACCSVLDHFTCATAPSSAAATLHQQLQLCGASLDDTIRTAFV